MTTNFIGVLLPNSPNYTVNTGFSTQLYDAEGAQTVTVETGASLVLVGALGANTIRLAAFARRREIGIMRLVGASTLYIALPFLLEALVTAVAGVALAGGALAVVMKFGVIDSLSKLRWDAWVGWHEYWIAVGIISVLGVVMTVAPTLLLTRKYIKV